MIVERRGDIEEARQNSEYAVLDFVDGDLTTRQYIRISKGDPSTRFYIGKKVLEAMRDVAYARGGIDAVRAIRVPDASLVKECERLLGFS